MDVEHQILQVPSKTILKIVVCNGINFYANHFLVDLRIFFAILHDENESILRIPMNYIQPISERGGLSDKMGESQSFIHT